MAWTHTRSKIAHYGRQHPGQPIPVDLKRQLKEERLEEHVRRVVGEAPPLSAEAADRIAALLRPTGRRIVKTPTPPAEGGACGS